MSRLRRRGDVFFLTTAKLTSQDSDQAFDLYDAHECASESPCIAPPLTRAQKLAKALRSCRKDRAKKKRVACEASARRKYGAVKRKKKSRAPR